MESLSGSESGPASTTPTLVPKRVYAADLKTTTPPEEPTPKMEPEEAKVVERLKVAIPVTGYKVVVKTWTRSGFDTDHLRKKVFGNTSPTTWAPKVYASMVVGNRLTKKGREALAKAKACLSSTRWKYTPLLAEMTVQWWALDRAGD